MRLRGNCPIRVTAALRHRVTRPAAGNQSPRRLSEMRAAASCAPRENSRRSPREVDRQPPDHADNSRPTSKPAGTDEGPEAVAELFDDFLVFALAESDLWDVIASALPEELFDRIDRHVEALLAVPWEQGR